MLIAALAALLTLSSALVVNPGAAHAATTYPCGTAWPGVYGTIGAHYYDPGIGEGLGCPTNWEYDGWGGNREQDFQGGFMHWEGSINRAFATWGEIGRLWRTRCGGLNGRLGPPTSDEHDAYWNGRYVRKSNFQNGWIAWDKEYHTLTAADRWGNYPC
ncbi:LGFP repeat-containing protein [Micromonospora sp. NPDC002575]|uniref:LGFP repeat-containing protein n=1 Tax=Micromonospora sp. NPDC002575 TaxID=3364222 RepID=UPI00368D5580